MKISPIVISSRIRLARNFDGLPFPVRLTDEDQAVGITKAIFEIYGEDYEFRQLKNLTSSQCLMLLEKRIVSKELIGNKDIASYALSQDQEISIMINEEDHIREQCIMKGLCLKECYEKITKVDDKLLSSVDIAFSKQYGFLTCCPTNVGTGMRASVMMFLPALTISGAMQKIIETANAQKLTIRGLFGEGSDADGYFYQISNKTTLGQSEEEIINLVVDFVKKVINMEENARKTLINLNQSVIMDMCLRAYGVLTHCYSISTTECISLLSKLRFGICTGLIKTKNINIDEMYYLIQPAHIENYYEIELSPKERDIFRAKYIGELLNNKLIKGE